MSQKDEHKKLHNNEIRQIIRGISAPSYSKQRKTEETLQKTNDPRFLEIVLEMLKADESRTVLIAIRALSKLKQFNPAQFLPNLSPFLDNPIFCEAVMNFMREHADREFYLKRLFGLLSHPDNTIRYMALQKIESFSYPALPNLLEISLTMIHDSSPEIRALVCRILGSSQDERALDALIDLLQDTGVYGYYATPVASTAALCLGRIANQRAVEPLMDAVRYGDESVGVNAVQALAGFAKQDLIEFFIEQLRSHHSEIVRIELVEVLGFKPDAKTTEALIGILETDASYEVQKAVASVLRHSHNSKVLEIAEKWVKLDIQNRLRKRYGLPPI